MRFSLCPDGALGRIEPHLQPQVRLADGAVVGAEALVRWRHPQEGLVAPPDFLWALDEMEHRELLHHVLREVVGLIGSGACALETISVNAEPFNLDADLARFVRGLLDDAGVHPGRLRIEVTEGAPGSPAAVHACMQELSRGGVLVSLDDIGTGFSSMARLQHVHVDEIKVDRKLFQAAAKNARAAIIVGAITALGADLGATTVAEGIETPEHARFAQELGFTIGQGFLWSPAVPAPQLEAWLAARPALAAAAA